MQSLELNQLVDLRIPKNMGKSGFAIPHKKILKKSGFAKSTYKLNKVHIFFYLPQVEYCFVEVSHHI